MEPVGRPHSYSSIIALSGCLQSFFTRWWREQTAATKDLVRKLVNNGQLDFVNGGYVQHDEAAAHYVAMIDQTTRGHRSAPHAALCICISTASHSLPEASLRSVVLLHI